MCSSGAARDLSMEESDGASRGFVSWTDEIPLERRFLGSTGVP